MNDINKQRFLAELGKLLTFMCEEDRHTALAMYNKMFDDAVDEQKLMELLSSPTRQAVVIARAYNAAERKAQLASHQPVEGADHMPAFMLAIDELYQQVAPRREEPVEEPEPAIVDQFSLFADDAHPIDDSEYVPFQIEAEEVSLEEPVEELPQQLQETLPAEPETVEEAPADPAAPEEAEGAREPAPAMSLPQEPEFILEPAPAEPVFQAPVSVEEAPAPRQKAKVFLLILYVILAVPVTLAGIVLLLIPTLLALALAVGVIAAGSAVLIAAFSGFPKLADILIVLGISLVVLAVGLLFLWLFIWFVGGAIVGWIRGVIALGRKWCYEEVPV